MPTRYDRQLIEFSAEEQEKIRTTTVGIVGCGGLGSYVTTALALAGIGKMVIIDPDSPEITNLNRQFIYCKTVLNDAEPDRKARICSQWIKDLNPEVDVEYHIGRFDETTCGIFDECDIMVDCLDSISSRMERRPLLMESASSWEMIPCFASIWLWATDPSMSCLYILQSKGRDELKSLTALSVAFSNLPAHIFFAIAIPAFISLIHVMIPQFLLTI